MKKKINKTEQYLKSIAESLDSIRTSLALILSSQQFVKALDEQKPVQDFGDYWLIDFPAMTAEEIYKKSKNKAYGGKLLYNIDWYKNEGFFTKEKTRKGKRKVYKELFNLGKNWDDCKKDAGNKGLEMLNFAESFYLLWKEKEMLQIVGNNPWRYTWLSSKSSDLRFLYSGGFGECGASVNGSGPYYTSGSIGVVFSCTAEVKND